ncbi:MAG: ferritin-like domain-containing protein [Chitinophagaceae bacterium]|nr:ferritin-like domain-containing protein [Chitinophagaceae bacterium]
MDYQSWKQHFQSNQHQFDHIDWHVVDHLTEHEKETICTSLQQFQRGENSEGKHLLKYAKKFADPSYAEAIKLFIKEEQRHAMILAQFMDLHKIPRIKDHWVDSIFRALRKYAGLENTIIVLVTAEIIAKVYYRSLGSATDSIILKKICHQILADEDQHLLFQADTLHHFYRDSSRLHQIVTRSWHRLLMTGTIFVVWFSHRKVLKSNGGFFGRFFMETMLVYFEVERSIKRNLATSPERGRA